MRTHAGRLWMLSVAVAAIAGMLCVAPEARAQNTLTLTSTSVTIPQPTLAAYDTARSEEAVVGFTVTAPSGSASQTRIQRVLIKCLNVTGGSKTCSDVQWRLTSPDVIPWTDMTTSFVLMTARCIKRNTGPPGPTGCIDAPPSGDVWSGTVPIRMKLSFPADPPGSYVVTVNITLEVYVDS